MTLNEMLLDRPTTIDALEDRCNDLMGYALAEIGGGTLEGVAAYLDSLEGEEGKKAELYTIAENYFISGATP